MAGPDETLPYDWDYYAANFASLRIYLFEHHSIPTVDFFFCGGRPALGNPQSYAYTWPSVFAYLFPGNTAVLVLYLFMIVAGLLIMARLLHRWTRAPVATVTGTCLYLFNGYYLSHFHVGHVPWGFFHLVPLLILIYDATVGARLQSLPSAKPLFFWSVVASFLFVTSGLPHALIYFYPAFLVFVAYRFLEAWFSEGPRDAVRASLFASSAHLAGLWIGMYKLWPVLVWQHYFPRTGVWDEKHSLRELLGFTLFLHPGHEADAALGVTACLVSLVLVLGLFGRALTRRCEATDRRWNLAWFAFLAVVFGTLMAMGNNHPLSPAFYLKKTFLGGVRLYSRYQAMNVFGLSVLCALAVSFVERGFHRRAVGIALSIALSVLLLVPLCSFGLHRSWALNPRTPWEAIRTYRVIQHTATPMYLGARWGFASTFLVEHGYWVGACYDPMTVERPRIPAEAITRPFPITNPPPSRVIEMGANHVTFEFPEVPEQDVEVFLAPRPEFVHFDKPWEYEDGLFVIRQGQMTGKTLTIRFDYPGNVLGALLGASGVVFLLVLRVGFFGSNRERSGRLSRLARAQSSAAHHATKGADA